MMKRDVAEEGFEVEAPPVFPNEEVEEDPSIVEGGGGGRENVIINNNGVPQQQKTWYSKTIGKVAILFVAVFAVCVAIGYVSGYGINEKILSNKAAASVSTKNGAYETYDTPSTAAKAAKASSETKASKASSDGSTKSSKTGTTTTTSSTAVSTTIDPTTTSSTSTATTSQATTTTTPQTTSETSTSSTIVSSTTTTQTTSEASTTSTSTVTSSTSTTTTATTTVATTPTPDDSECRLLAEEPIEEDVPFHRRIELIRNLNAKADASYSVKHNLISTKSCDALIQHIEVAHDHDVDSGIELPTANSEHSAEVVESETYTAFNGGIENQYNQKLSADKIVSLIGKDETKKLIDYFYESLGNLDINSMVLIRHGIPADGGHYDIGWHTDSCETVEVTLNDNYEGGRLLHLNLDGVHRTDTRTGTAIAHSDDVVHGLPSNSDIRYTLVLKHYPGMDGIVKLSHEIVNNMN